MTTRFPWPACLVLAVCVVACRRAEPHAQVVSEPRGATTASQRGTELPERTAPAAERSEVALLAGGCFWGMEELLRKEPGVLDTTVGYAGGTVESPTYEDVASGRSGHAESVRVVFDPSKTSYEKVLLFFFTIHDPTTRNRQGNDIGAQYRSAIFVLNDRQRHVAERVRRRVEESGEWNGPITTEITPAGRFYSAEKEHQDYLQRNPGGYTCHYQRDLSF